MAQALVPSMLAGLATVLGALVVLAFGQPNTRLLAVLLGLASGVMLAVVSVDLLPEALAQGSRLATAGGFAAGVLLLALVDNRLSKRRSHRRKAASRQAAFTRMGLLVALGIALHDLPEGLAIGAGFASTEDLGSLLALAIGLHNIPEGISMAAPLLFGGWRPWKVVALCSLVALLTPLGTLASLLILGISPAFIAVSLAFAAGAMIFVVIDELIPMAHETSRLLTAGGLTLGFVLMLLVL